MTKIAIVYYSMYGHIRALAQGIKKGIESADVEVQLFQVQETLPAEILSKMGAPPKSDDPVATPNVIAEFDGIIFGVSARYGGLSAQFHAFLDSTGSLQRRRLSRSNAIHNHHRMYALNTHFISSFSLNLVTTD